MKKFKLSKIINNNGFTMIELMVTLSIIGIVSTGLFTLMGHVKTLQVDDRELDEINMLVSSYVESLRYSPDEAIDELGLKINGTPSETKTKDADGNLTAWKQQSNYLSTIYLNKKMISVPKADAAYSVEINLKKAIDKTGASNFTPNMQNQRYKGFNLEPTITNYVVWVCTSLTSAEEQASNKGYLDHNYEVVMINDLTADKFDDYLIQWGATTHNSNARPENITYTAEESLYKERYRLFREIIAEGTWYRTNYPWVIAPSQFNVDEQIQTELNVRGSIPVRIIFEQPPVRGGRYNIDVINDTSEAFDFYLEGDENNPMVEIKSIIGATNVTYLKPDRDEKIEYDFEMFVKRIENGSTLVDYQSGYYYAD